MMMVVGDGGDVVLTATVVTTETAVILVEYVQLLLSNFSLSVIYSEFRLIGISFCSQKSPN